MTQLALDGARATMAKISINVLGQDADNTVFTVPLEGIELSREQLNQTLGDRTFESWYQQRRDGAWHPMDWFHARKDGSFEIDESFTAEAVTIGVEGNKKLEFETIKAEKSGEDDIPAAKIGSLVFKPTAGGVTLLSLHLQVRPGTGQKNLALQKQQYRPITITVSDIAQAKRKGAQQDLAFEPGSASTPAGTDTGEGPRPVSGGFVQTKSAAEIDEEMRRRTPNGTPLGDNAEFEAGARAQVAAFSAKPGEVVDGRSERVKHQDATRGGNGGRSRHR